IHTPRHVCRSQLAQSLRFLSLRARRVLELGADDAQRSSWDWIAAVDYRGPGRGRHPGSLVTCLLGIVCRLHDEPFVVAKRSCVVGLIDGQAAWTTDADPGDWLAKGTGSR